MVGGTTVSLFLKLALMVAADLTCMCVYVLSEPPEPVQRELTALDQEIEKQTVQLREWQMQELLKLRRQLYSVEREKQQTHLQEVTAHAHTCARQVSAPPPVFAHSR